MYDNDDIDDPVDEDVDSESTFPCPGCTRPVYEEADACPYCGEYLAWEDAYPHRGRPWWVTLGAVAALVATFAGGIVMLLALLWG